MMRAFVIGVATTLLLLPLAFAADQPLTGRKVLLVKRASGAEKVVFLSRDTAVTAPTPGGLDDPTTVGRR